MQNWLYTTGETQRIKRYKKSFDVTQFSQQISTNPYGLSSTTMYMRHLEDSRYLSKNPRMSL